MTELELKELRRKLGLTQVQLAEIVGVDVKTIQNWEAGRRIPKTKDGILRGLETKNHVVFGGQFVTGGGDAVNGDKIVEKIKEEVEDEQVEEVTVIKKVKCDLEDIRKELADLKKTHAEVVSQNSRLLAIIENLTNTK